jgi:hydroxypyruvate isomerase
MSWFLRYAPHLGYRPPFDPLFAASGGADRLSQIDFAADMGFAGVLCAAARGWAPQEQERVGAALTRRGLAAGCMLYTTFDKLTWAAWGDDSAGAHTAITGELQAAIEAARRIGATRLAVLGGADPRRPLPLQHAALVQNLRFAADLAQAAGMVLCLETLNRRSVPNMLLHHIDDAYAVVRAVGRPEVRLIFDTAHVQAMDGDLLLHVEATWDAVEIVQIADNPGRTEPGSGEINFDNVWRQLARHGYRGLVELEHGWSHPGPDAERQGIEVLRRLDAVAAACAQQLTPSR